MDYRRTSRGGIAGPLWLGLAASLVLVVSGCAPPLRVQQVPPEVFYREQTRNILSSWDVSDASLTVLRQHSLLDYYQRDPQGAIETLNESVRRGSGGSDELFAMAELALMDAQASDDRRQYLAAVFYSYAFLFPDAHSQRTRAFDPRTRVAADIYSRALAQALRDSRTGLFVPQSGTLPLRKGAVEIRFEPAMLQWHDYVLEDFTPVGELKVTGMRNRYRRAGIGTPLAARPVPPNGIYDVDDLVGPSLRIPVTALLTFDSPRKQLATDGPLQASLALYAATDVEDLQIGDRIVPLESEPSVVLATTLAASKVWETELGAFLGAALPMQTRPILLRALEPYEPGKMPVVFVHGTASSIFRWTDMVNDLQNDPAIRQHYQFWFFTYDSGNPIAYSAYNLRRLLSLQVERFDPEGKDPALHRMVVIGHSQGGLLTKMTSIDSGDRFWANVSSKPFSEVKLTPKTRALLQDALFVKPLPFVERVVFISTPHQGSYLAGPELVRRLAQRLIRLPGDLVGLSADLTGLSQEGAMLSGQRLPTSIDNMSPGHPFIRALSSIPVDPRVKAHSIIPVEQEDDILDGDDGVVKYRSAHIEPVESELVVHDSHSTQSNPRTVEEVRRILHLQLDEK